jgi:hypothetical protein
MSADKSTLLKGFNTHFFDFLEDIANIIDNNTEILTSKVFFDTVKRANPTLLIKCWFTHVYQPYKDIIDSGDIEFFLEKDYGKDIAVLANAEEIINSINKIRGSIQGMTDINKQHSMKYIQNLSKLSFMYSTA